MRFSCRTVVRYTDDQGRYLLVVDKELYESYGEIVLVPPGGYAHTDMEGVNHLQINYGAYGFEYGVQLRFYADSSRFRDIERWFRERTHRETDAARILTEQFWDDPFWTRPFANANIRNMSRPLLGTSTDIGETFRRGVAETHTAWLTETHGMAFHSKAMRRIIADIGANAHSAHLSPFYFAQIEEIQYGATFDGVLIEQRLARRLATQDVVIGG